MLRATILVVLLFTPLAAGLAANDWPQFLGPSRTGVYVGAPLNEKWPSPGPRVIWRKQVGQGLSGPVVAGSSSFCFTALTIARSSKPSTRSPVLRNGATPIRRPTATILDSTKGLGRYQWSPVESSIPTAPRGKLYRHRSRHGKPLWNVDAMREFEVDKGFFGAAGSPLVEDGKVIANIGGRKAGIVAFDAKTGKVIWTATTDAASYSSGIAATMLGRRYAVFLTRAGLVGLDPATGQVRFQRPWRARQAASVNAATP
jgi:hypothetical protein